MSKSILEAIKELESEITEKQAVLRVLKQMNGNGISQAVTPTESVVEPLFLKSEQVDLHSGKVFPKNSRTDKQVMFLFDNVFKKAEKFATVQKKFNELLGTDKNVYNICRSLKKMGLLGLVQYNKQNKLSFWGKAEWVGEKDFLDEFKPDADEMPINVFDTKILTDEEDLLG